MLQNIKKQFLFTRKFTFIPVFSQTVFGWKLKFLIFLLNKMYLKYAAYLKKSVLSRHVLAEELIC